jgi:hypothetical protein
VAVLEHQCVSEPVRAPATLQPVAEAAAAIGLERAVRRSVSPANRRRCLDRAVEVPEPALWAAEQERSLDVADDAERNVGESVRFEVAVVEPVLARERLESDERVDDGSRAGGGRVDAAQARVGARLRDTGGNPILESGSPVRPQRSDPGADDAEAECCHRNGCRRARHG